MLFSYRSLQPRTFPPLLAQQTLFGARMSSASQNACSTELPASSIPIFRTVSALRAWRHQAALEGKTIGFVPTMGALHDGHLMLVKQSLRDNDLTVLSIFVNPTQFAPHEDLTSYPRTLQQDLQRLSSVSSVAGNHLYQTVSSDLKRPSAEAHIRTTAAVFLPSVSEMYPSGASQDIAQQKGTFVEVAGYGHVMEGRSRPTFFRGVATVVTKLFNAVQPTNAYFGQKDIQQALLLRRMQTDLLSAFPEPSNLHILPTAREKMDGLALSSRNAYLNPSERKYANVLYRALTAGKEAYVKDGLLQDGTTRKPSVIEQAYSVFLTGKEAAAAEGVELQLDYIQLNDPWDFDPVEAEKMTQIAAANGKQIFILSGAMWVGRTRLIDNVLLGDEGQILF